MHTSQLMCQGYGRKCEYCINPPVSLRWSHRNTLCVIYDVNYCDRIAELEKAMALLKVSPIEKIKFDTDIVKVQITTLFKHKGF